MAEDRQMRADEQDEYGRHQPDVEPEEAVDRGRSHRAAALRDMLDNGAGSRSGAGYVEGDLRREIGIHVPWQQIAREAEYQGDEQQEYANDPLQLARRFVRAPNEDLQQMQEDQGDHRRGAPIVDGKQEV